MERDLYYATLDAIKELSDRVRPGRGYVENAFVDMHWEEYNDFLQQYREACGRPGDKKLDHAWGLTLRASTFVGRGKVRLVMEAEIPKKEEKRGSIQV